MADYKEKKPNWQVMNKLGAAWDFLRVAVKVRDRTATARERKLADRVEYQSNWKIRIVPPSTRLKRRASGGSGMFTRALESEIRALPARRAERHAASVAKHRAGLGVKKRPAPPAPTSLPGDGRAVQS